MVEYWPISPAVGGWCITTLSSCGGFHGSMVYLFHGEDIVLVLDFQVQF